MKIVSELVLRSCKGNQMANGEKIHTLDSMTHFVYVIPNQRRRRKKPLRIDIEPYDQVYLKCAKRRNSNSKKRVSAIEKNRTIRLIDDDYL